MFETEKKDAMKRTVAHSKTAQQTLKNRSHSLIKLYDKELEENIYHGGVRRGRRLVDKKKWKILIASFLLGLLRWN